MSIQLSTLPAPCRWSCAQKALGILLQFRFGFSSAGEQPEILHLLQAPWGGCCSWSVGHTWSNNVFDFSTWISHRPLKFSSFWLKLIIFPLPSGSSALNGTNTHFLVTKARNWNYP